MSKLRVTVSRLLALGGLTAVSGSGIAVYNSLLKDGAECRPATSQHITAADYGKKETDPLQTRFVNNWDDNWDYRNPKNDDKKREEPNIAVLEQDGTTVNVPAKPLKSTATRHVILIRHGQYVYADGDNNRILTELGRQQASATGERIKSLNIKWDRMIVSTMTRAQETASLIGESLPDIPSTECSLLREGAPYPPEPSSKEWKPKEHKFFQDNPRIEAAFRKYIHRASPEQKEDSHDVIVCHGNVIRYFVCRALQFPPEGWLRMSIGHCGVTWLSIRPNGRVSLRGLGDTGHLPPDMVTFS